MPRGKRKGFAFVDGQRVLKPLPPGVPQCPHTLKPQAQDGCSQCLGSRVTRMISIDGPQIPEARPTNPTKHFGS